MQQVVAKLATADAQQTTVEGLAALLPFAGSVRADLLEQAWRTLGEITLDVFSVDALLALVPTLGDAELERALGVITTFDDVELRSQVIESNRGPRFAGIPGQRNATARIGLQLIDEIKDPYEKALACGTVLPAAPVAQRDELVGMALANFDKIEGDEYLSADEKAQIVSAAVLPYASDVGRALDVIAGFEDGRWRAKALIASAENVSRATFDKALEIAHTLDPADRDQALLALERAAPEVQKRS